MGIISYISSLFIQKKCFGCQKSEHFFCPQCSNNLYTYDPYCYVCKKPSDNFSVHDTCRKHFSLREVIVLTRYKQAGVKKLLRHAKYYGKYTAYWDIMNSNEDFFKKHMLSQNSILAPVPMSFFRKWKRGYNQADKIAENVSKICHIPVEKGLIYRAGCRPQQSHLSAEKRRVNIVGAFSFGKTRFVDKSCTIYLVDDIISTGSTLGEIAKILQENGYKDIRAVVLASD